MEIAIVAGEVSGDIQASRLIESLRERNPKIKVWGIGGSYLSAQGVELVFDITQWALIGFWEVIKNYRKIRRIFYSLIDEIVARKPQAIILVDYPGFNLRLAKKIRHLNIPIIYYISPQVWAWGKGRIKQISRLIDEMIVIFPFEEDMYRQAGVSAYFVGHPIIDVLDKCKTNREVVRREFDLAPGQRLIGIFPGSRVQEVDHHLPELLAAVKLLREKDTKLRFVIGAASEKIARQINQYDPSCNVLQGRTYDIMLVSDLVLTSSGTATLETACFGTPLVVFYKLNWMTYCFIRSMIKVPNIAMVNVVAGKRIVPELVQNKVNAVNIAAEAWGIMSNPEKQEIIKKDLAVVKNKLGEPGVAKRAAKIVTDIIEANQAC